MMHPSLKRMLAQTIVAKRLTGHSLTGSEELGAARNIPAYVEMEVKHIQLEDGTERTTTHLIVTEEEVTEDDRIWLPGADSTTLSTSKKPAIVGVFFVPFSDEIDHYEVTL